MLLNFATKGFTLILTLSEGKRQCVELCNLQDGFGETFWSVSFVIIHCIFPGYFYVFMVKYVFI